MVSNEQVRKILERDGVRATERELTLVREFIVEMARIEYESFLRKNKKPLCNQNGKQEISINNLKKAS